MIGDGPKVAYVTGAARGQGRAHALTLAAAGYDIVGIDLAGPMETVGYPSCTPDDLAETVRLVEQTGRECLGLRADVRDRRDQDRAVQAGLERFGRIDVAVANAAILPRAKPIWEIGDAEWDATIGTNLSGAWQTIRAVAPTMIAQGTGSIVVTGSTLALGATASLAPYVASKHGVVGLVKAAAIDLAPHGVRVNAVCPTTVDTPMIAEAIVHFSGGNESATVEDAAEGFSALTLLPPGYLAPEQVAQVVRFLVSDAAAAITGATVPVDAGASITPAG